MTVNAFLRRGPFNNRIHVHNLLLGNQAVNRYGPGTSFEIFCQASRSVLVGRKLVIIVVVGYVLVWCDLLCCGERTLLNALDLGIRLY